MDRTHFAFFTKREDKRQKIVFTEELLEMIGEKGWTNKEAAKQLGCSPTLISRHINRTVANRNAYERGKLKTL